MKKAAIMIYPNFSLQEITTLTSIFMLNEKEIDVFAAEKQIYNSEDGFQVLPNKTFEEFVLAYYDVLILPGIFGFGEALEESKNISFLKKLSHEKEILIASISSSPVLLAKAGLLEEKQFCSGLFEEAFDMFPFLPKENVVREPLKLDGNVLTGMGFAFREFAIEVCKYIGISVSPSSFSGIRKEPPYTADELTFFSSEKE